uniref:Uncharacterized protein n=1 Tax=Anguilla anguilla TaxID=7936 RepID=A0A0E9UXS1_ANGAN
MFCCVTIENKSKIKQTTKKRKLKRYTCKPGIALKPQWSHITG